MLFRSADEIAVALFVLCEDEQVVVVVALRIGAMVVFLADVELAAENGMDAVVLCRVEKMHRAVDVAVVGNGDGLLTDAGDVLDELFNVAGAVEQGVVGVEMKMSEFRHGCCFYFRSRAPGGVRRIVVAY